MDSLCQLMLAFSLLFHSRAKIDFKAAQWWIWNALAFIFFIQCSSCWYRELGSYLWVNKNRITIHLKSLIKRKSRIKVIAKVNFKSVWVCVRVYSCILSTQGIPFSTQRNPFGVLCTHCSFYLFIYFECVKSGNKM